MIPPGLGQKVLTYAPFWLQVAYVFLKALLRVDAWPLSLAGDICFAGFSFFVWTVTMILSANRQVAGGGKYNATAATRREELGLGILILVLSMAGIATGYRNDAWVIVAYLASLPIAILGTRMLRPPATRTRTYI